MLPDSYRELFSALAAKTARGEVNWTRSPRTDTFVVSFADFGLSVYTGDDERGESFVLFKLINDKGRDADSFFVAESEPEWEAAYQLYAGAKRKAQRIDLTPVSAVPSKNDLRYVESLVDGIPALVGDLLLHSSAILRNRATLTGNIVNASPIADAAIMLLALNARRPAGARIEKIAV